jgi:Flp pilus assembly protein TadG
VIYNREKLTMSQSANCVFIARRPLRSERGGVIVVLTTVLLVFLLGVVAFAIDIGFVANVRSELQAATDAAAFAGAGALVTGTGTATTAAQTFYTSNRAGGNQLTTSSLGIEFGQWDSNSRTFSVSNTQPNAIRVSSSLSNQPLFFGSVFNQKNFNMTAKAVATYMPRDIVMVLDYSGSMCFDSQFYNLGLLPQSEIEANLKQIWTELGSPTYGTLNWNPLTRGTSSTKNSDITKYFKLDNVPYPYPGGSWSEYVDYVQTDGDIAAAGYQNKYGMMTFINYLLDWRRSTADTPGLDKVSEQPVTALKDAVDVFLSYLQSQSTDDRVGLSIYSYSDGTAILESSLTKTYSTISSICRARQAAHYIGGTNISAGMTKARVELMNNARGGAKKIMVLMTDGVVNMPTGNTTSDKAAVIAEANLAAAAKIPIVTIALGAYADTALMQQVADITGGSCFVVPGGQPIADVTTQLQAVFGQVAADRPLKLVQ